MMAGAPIPGQGTFGPDSNPNQLVVTHETFDEPKSKDAMDDAEIRQITDKHIQEGITFCFDQLGQERNANMAYYLGLPEYGLEPPTIPDRSSVVSTDVSDTVEWMLPALMAIFTAGPSVVEFVPRKEGDEEAANQATEYLNYVFYQQNPGWHELYTWFKDALIQKVGIMKAWWDDSPEVVTEFYRGMTDDQLTAILEDDAVEPTEHTSYPDPAALHKAQADYDVALQAFARQQAMIKTLVATGWPEQMAQQAAAASNMARGGPMPPMPPPPPPAPPGPPPGAAMAGPGGPPGAAPGGPPMPPPPGAGAPPMPPPGAPPGAGPAGAPGAPPGPPPPPAAPPGPPLLKPPRKPNPAMLPMLHDVRLTRTSKGGRVKLLAVPFEEFIISPYITHPREGFTAHRVKRTISYLRERGYENVDDIELDELGSDTSIPAGPYSVNAPMTNPRYAFQNAMGPVQMTSQQGYGDETQREVWLTECYLPIDVDGDGVSEWRKITRAGNAILDNEPIDGPPWAALCPCPIPHVFFGRGEADLAMQAMKVKTQILRGALDNLAFQTNARTFAVDGMVNMDDLLTNRPGGVVRMKQAGMAGPLSSNASDPAVAFQLLQYSDEMKQDATGVTKYTQGSDADTLNKTATGLANITNRADMRVELVARVFAETGVKDLFWLMLKLCAQFQDQPAVVRLTGKWVTVDPREWWNRFDMSVNVGLGTGNKDQAMAHLQAIMQLQQAGAQGGFCTPKNMYNAASKMCAVLGFRDPDQFFTDPAKMPPAPPPPPDPTIAATQAQTQAALQIEGQKNQTDQQKIVLENQLDMKKASMEDNRQRDHDATQFAIQREELLFKYGVHPIYEGITFISAYKQNEQALGGQAVTRPNMAQFNGIPGVPSGGAIPVQPNPGNPGGGIPGGPEPSLPGPGTG